MSEQVADRSARLGGDGDQPAIETACGVVAVASGPGIRRLFEELGALVVDGGPTMNPSTYELLAGIHSAQAAEVVVLPNSPNVILAAERRPSCPRSPCAWSPPAPSRRGSRRCWPSTPACRPPRTPTPSPRPRAA